MINVIIIEDNKHMREGWKTILDFNPDIVVTHTFERCEDAFASNYLKGCDLVLLDIELPGMSGIEGVKVIKETYPNTLVLMVTIYDDNDKIFSAIKNGAVGYLLKKVSPAELTEAVKSVIQGGSPMSPTIARKVISSFHARDSETVTLSDKEREVLSALSDGLSYKAVADQLFLSVDGVRYHIRNIYHKLEAKNRAEAVAKGHRFNLIKKK